MGLYFLNAVLLGVILLLAAMLRAVPVWVGMTRAGRKEMRALIVASTLIVWAVADQAQASREAPQNLGAFKACMRVAAEKIAERARTSEHRLDRNAYVEKYASAYTTTEAQNIEWIAAAKKTHPGTAKRYFHSENSVLKRLNQRNDKNFVTAFNNRQSGLLLSRIRSLVERTSGVEILSYSDYKGLDVEFGGKIPEGFDRLLEAEFQAATREAANEIREFKIMRTDDVPESWFRSGYEDTADLANSYARVARGQENGNRMITREVGEPRVKLEEGLRKAEDLRVSIEKILGTTAALSGQAGAMAPTPEVFNMIRKTESYPELALKLQKRFRLKDPPGYAAKALKEYDALLDLYSPALRIASRETAGLDNAQFGGMTVDFRGLGAVNRAALARAIANVTDLNFAIESARVSEEKVSRVVNRRRTAFKNLLDEIARCSGDDCAAAFHRALTRRERKELVEELAKNRRTRSIRIAFVPGAVKGGEYTALATHGETIESLLRANLEVRMDPKRLNDFVFAVDMQTTTLGHGQVGLIQVATGKPANVAEIQMIEAAFEGALTKFNATYPAGQTPPSYWSEAKGRGVQHWQTR